MGGDKEEKKTTRRGREGCERSREPGVQQHAAATKKATFTGVARDSKLRALTV